MKEYPSIPRTMHPREAIYAFDKLDGSNVRAEWHRKKGFWKFGRRHGLLDDSNPILRRAEQLILEKYEDDLGRILTQLRAQKAIAFFEFWGPGSFAGNHLESEQQTVTLFDISVDNRGIMLPRDFLRTFEEVDHARLLYHGNCNEPFMESVRESVLPGMTFEGVVCKGGYIHPGLPLMFKVKSRAWLEKLKQHCHGDVALFERLQ